MSLRIPVSAKLVAALAVPLAALVTVSLIEVHRSDERADAVVRQAALAEATTGPGGVVAALQDERDRAVADLVGAELGAEVAPDLLSESEARAATDQAIEQFGQTVESAPSEVQVAYRPAQGALADLATLRARFDDGSVATLDEVTQTYAELSEPFALATDSLVNQIDDGELRAGASILGGIANLADAEGDLAQVLLATSGSTIGGTAGGATTANLVALSSALTEAEQWRDAIAADAVGPYSRVTDALESPARSALYRSADDVLEGTIATSDELVAAVQEVTSDPTANLTSLRGEVATELSALADQKVADTQSEQRLVLLLAVAALLLADGVALGASRSITRPLRRLTVQANDMANRRLPAAVGEVLDTPLGDDVVMPELAPIDVKTRDEVREVVKALNVVQSSALALATEQAVLRRNIADAFVHLGRRNQNLLARQLELITDLERDESDPDSLDSLFRLDHLATRMRRNAESLLVLAGLQQTRQWSAPVTLSGVVRAAIGEVEEYTRVELALFDEPRIQGSAAADLAHLLAELLENALAWSPAPVAVEVVGRPSADLYRLLVIDHGVGMAEPERTRANRRLSGEESFTVAPSRYLGHYVAGRLAQRLGVTCQLTETIGGGVTVEVTLPVAILVRDDAPSDGGGVPAPSATSTVEAPIEAVSAPDSVLSRRVRGSRLAEFGLPPVADPVAPLVVAPSAPVQAEAQDEDSRDAEAVRDFFAAFRAGTESGQRDGAIGESPFVDRAEGSRLPQRGGRS